MNGGRLFRELQLSKSYHKILINKIYIITFCQDMKILDLYIRKICGLFCHQKKERSFCIGNYVFPLCARCTGVMTGFIIAVSCLSLNFYMNVYLSLILILPMTIDGGIQYFGLNESTNVRRFITGTAGGIGLSYTYYYIIKLFLNSIY